MTSRRQALIGLASGLGLAAFAGACRGLRSDHEASIEGSEREDMKIHYLEIVTPELEATCKAYEQILGVSFGEPAPELGNARTAQLAGGGLLGVRAPMRPDEAPVVRPYVLVDDIAAAVERAAAAGAEIALPPMEIPGRGQCAIYLLGGIEHALWQV